MIRNGVIDATVEFAERRYLADTDREFNELKKRVMDEHSVGIEICRTTYHEARRKIFALVGDLLVNTYQEPPFICEYGKVR